MSKYFTIVLLLLSLIALPSVGLGSDYIVARGDTLNKIAERELGDWHKWKYLARINALKIVKRNGVVHVDLEVGQQLKLTEWTARKVAAYYLVTKQILEKEIFEIAGIKRVSIPITDIQIEFDPTSQEDLRLTQIQLETILFNLACQERLLMARDIFKYTKENPLHFFKDKKWIAHRKTAFLLMALLDTESDGYFARGRHGEWGPYQIKAETYRVVMKHNGSNVGITLMTSHLAGMKCALTILRKRQNARDALLLYNSGSFKRKHAYADRVLKSFRRILAKAAKMDVI